MCYWCCSVNLIYTLFWSQNISWVGFLCSEIISWKVLRTLRCGHYTLVLWTSYTLESSFNFFLNFLDLSGLVLGITIILTLFTINYNEFLFRGLEKEKLSSWSGVLYCWACPELFVSMLFEENNWPSLFLLIFYSYLNEYYFLSKICNVIILM